MNTITRLFLLALLLTVSISNAQIGGSVVPGSLSCGGGSGAQTVSSWSGVTNRTGLVLELYGGVNYYQNSLGNTAKWLDFKDSSRWASQSIDINKPTAGSNYIRFYPTNFLTTTSLGLSAGAHTIICAVKMRGNALSQSGGYGPEYFTNDLTGANMIQCVRNYNVQIEVLYAGTLLNNTPPTATETIKYIAATFDNTASGSIQVNSSNPVTGSTGVSGLPINRLTIGAQSTGSEPIDGDYYAFLVYSRKLSVAEIRALFTEISVFSGVPVP